MSERTDLHDLTFEIKDNTIQHIDVTVAAAMGLHVLHRGWVCRVLPDGTLRKVKPSKGLRRRGTKAKRRRPKQRSSR